MRLIGAVLSIAAVFLAGSFILQGEPSYASSIRKARSASLQKLRELDCGYEPRGAQDEVSAHQLNVQRRRNYPDPRTAVLKKFMHRTSEDFSGVCIINAEGTMVIPESHFDLKNTSIVLTPEAEGYRLSIGDLEFDKDFGSRLDFFLGADGHISPDADNGYRVIDLNSNPFSFYGVQYETAFVGTNGYITFGRGDTGARISPSALAADLPRIAPLWSDLEVTDSGSIFYNRLPGRHLFTWNRAGQPLYSGASTFQAVLYDDGRIAFVYKKVKAHAALVGISPGGLINEPNAVDFSEPPTVPLTGALFETFAKQERLDLPAILNGFYSAHEDVFDAVYVWSDFDYDNGLGVARSFNIRNDIQGIGLSIVDRGGIYASPAKLATIISMGNETNWPADPGERTAGLNSAISIVCHELGHRWLSYVRFKTQNEVHNDLLGRDNSHWSFLVDSRTNDEGSFSSLMEGNAWRESAGNIFTTVESAVNYFSRLDQYLMGLRAAEQVEDIEYLETSDALTDLLREKSPTSGFSMTATRRTTSISKIVDEEGPRVPDVTTSPKEFRVAFIVLTQRSSGLPSPAVIDKVTRYRDSLERYFFLATEKLGSLSTSLE